MAKIYSTKEISILLGVNQETVRRWLREGTLKGGYTSTKGGFKVKEYDLYDFIHRHPKYRLKKDLDDSDKIALSKAIIDQRIFEIESLICKLSNELDGLRDIQKILKTLES